MQLHCIVVHACVLERTWTTVVDGQGSSTVIRELLFPESEAVAPSFSFCSLSNLRDFESRRCQRYSLHNTIQSRMQNQNWHLLVFVLPADRLLVRSKGIR